MAMVDAGIAAFTGWLTDKPTHKVTDATAHPTYTSTTGVE